MKIIHVCGWYFPDSLGGTETYVAAVADRQRAAGHHVGVAAPDPGGHTERSYVIGGLPVYRYPTTLTPTRDEVQQVVPTRGTERFHAWLKDRRADIVHFHTFVTGVGIHEVRAARAAGSRVFVTTHSGSLGYLCQRGTMMRWGKTLCDGRVTPAKCSACALQQRGVPRPVADAVGLVPPLLSRAGALIPGRAGTLLSMPHLIRRNLRLQREMFEQVEAFVVLTDWAREVVTANDGHGAPVVLNRLGIRARMDDVRALRRAPRREQRSHLTVAYVGRFDRIKGVHDLALAARALPPGTPVQIEFRGPVSNLHDLEIVNELKGIVGPDAWIRFGPPLEPDDVFRYLSEIDLLCCPSRTLEGGPTVALEAMAVGTPVLATNIGALPELITDGVNGRLVPPANVAALAKALAAIAKDPEGTIDRWRQHLPEARSMDDVTGDYLDLYAKALDA